MRVSFLILLLCTVSSASGEYAEALDRAESLCDDINKRESASGMWLNSAGQQAYFKRSRCFNDLALLYRRPEHCEEVREKWALLSSGWYYTADACRERVKAAMNEDRQSIQAVRNSYVSGRVRLVDFKVTRNGNGRDYDLRPSFNSAANPGSYALSFYLLASNDEILIAEDGFRLKGGENIWMFERLEDLRKKYPQFRPGMVARVRAELVFDPGDGLQSGRWRPDMIEEIFPAATRVQRLVRQVTF